MKYRLKDQELQKTLDEITDGDFSRQLEEHQERILFGLKYQEEATLWFCKTGGPLLSIEFDRNMLEPFLEYNPRAWNIYPDVEPPEGVWMRVQDTNHHGFRAIFRSVDGWLDDLGFRCGGEDGSEIEFFRPWDDEEDKE